MKIIQRSSIVWAAILAATPIAANADSITPAGGVVISADEVFQGEEAAAAVITPLVFDYGKLPPIRNAIGKRKLACVGIKYLDNPTFVTEAGCQVNADAMASFWGASSRGLLQIEAKGFPPIEVGLNGSKDAYAKGIAMVKAKYPGYNYYVIPGIYTNPHASDSVAHVKSAQVMTSLHEVGHLIGFGHAGAYFIDANGNVTLNAYADTDSIMGRVISKYITAPQYYRAGWLKPEAYTLYNESVQIYSLRKIGNVQDSGLATIIVSPQTMAYYGKDQTRYAFISASSCGGTRVPSCVSLHLSNNDGGSQKVAEFANEYYDSNFTGLHIKVLGHNSKGYAQVSVDFDQE